MFDGRGDQRVLAPEELLLDRQGLLEERFGQSVADQLSGLGHEVLVTDPLDTIMGTAQMIQVDREHGCFIASTDPRGDGVALAI